MADKVDFDQYTENYNALLHDSTKFFASNETYFARYKIDIVRKHVTKPIKNMYEFGCGIGRNIPFLKAAFPQAIIVGSDISEASLDVARKENPDIVFFETVDAIEEGKTFDLIFVAGVYHHIPPDERGAVTQSLFERLSVGGNLFVFEHNPYNPVTRKIVDECPYDEDAVLLKPAELKDHLETAGFNVLQKSYCLFVPAKFSVLAFIENWLGWFPLGGQYWIQAQRRR